jgi:hypothetical protein
MCGLSILISTTSPTSTLNNRHPLPQTPYVPAPSTPPKGLGNLQSIGLDARVTNNPALTTLADLPRSLRSVGAALVGDLVVRDNPRLADLAGLGSPGGPLSEVVGEVVIAGNGAGLPAGGVEAVRALSRPRQVTTQVVRSLLAAPAAGAAPAPAAVAAPSTAAVAPPAAGGAAAAAAPAQQAAAPPGMFAGLAGLANDRNTTAADNSTTSGAAAAPPGPSSTSPEAPPAPATPASTAAAGPAVSG